MLARLFLLILLVFPVFAADAETEVLRQKLAASEAARVVALRDKAMLQEALTKLVTESKAAAAARAAASEAVRTAKQIAEENSQMARQAEEVAAQRAEEAAVQRAVVAANAAEAAKAQNTGLMIVQFFGFATVIVGMLYKHVNEARTRRWAQEDARLQREEARQRQEEARQGISTVLNKLDVVEHKATVAYVEANEVNQKISAAGLEIKDQLKPGV